MQLQHFLSLFPFIFALNKARTCFSLSKLLMRELYCYRDIVLHLHNSIELMLILASYNYVCWGTRSSSNQTPTALLTTALVIWLDDHFTREIPTLDSLLEVTVTLLCVPLTMECSTRFILRKVQVATKHHPIIRSGLECNT